jgi:uncharacterized membrane protein
MLVDQLNKNKKNESYRQAVASDKPIRSVVKAISWRVVGTIDTLIVSLFITGEIKTATAIAGVDFATKMVLYFFHERVWNTIKWGR